MTHAAIFLLILFIVGRMPDPASSRWASDATDSIVWIRPGGGGGDGGGNRTPQPTRRANAPGHDRVTVPARPPAGAETPAAVTPLAEPSIDIPAHPTAAGLTELPGVIAPTAAGTLSLGAGTGPNAGDGRRRGLGDGVGDSLGEGQDKGAGGGFPQPGTNGISQPHLIREVKPLYSNGALQARIEGTVFMQAVVLGDGSVGDVWITRSLDGSFGLDQEAVRTVRQWRFMPAMQSGRPVAVVVPIEMQFTIR